VKVSPERLGAELRKSLRSVYLVAGDEPLLKSEAADSIRLAAREAGYSERELHVAERGFDWDALLASSDTLSLFASRRLLEIRLSSAKPGEKGGLALARLAGAPPADTIVLIVAPKLDKTAGAAKWVKAIDAAGVIVQVWPVDAGKLAEWIRRRMAAAGLEADRDAACLLAERVEGNLLAAQQEIDKLRLLHGPGRVDLAAVRASVADSARYDVFQLVDAALGGDPGRALRILAGLRAEGVEVTLLSWALARELRSLESMAWQLARGRSRAAVTGPVWQKRKPLVAAALGRLDLNDIGDLLLQLAELDQVIKGVRRGPTWDRLRAIVAAFAGCRLDGKRRVQAA
jgi:DNA polymerase-3 subunit delta